MADEPITFINAGELKRDRVAALLFVGIIG